MRTVGGCSERWKARAGVLRVVRVVVWRRQALGRVGVMLLGECGQQLGWANK